MEENPSFGSGVTNKTFRGEEMSRKFFNFFATDHAYPLELVFSREGNMSESALTSASDATLVARALDGDTLAFTVLLKRYRRLMMGYARSLTSDSADADDAVQEAFITAWKKLDALEDPAKAKAWLMRIVGHSAIDIMRRRGHYTPLEDDDILPAQATEPGPDSTNEIKSQLEAAGSILDALPLQQRQVWMMREVGGYSYKEIAEELDLPVSTVRGLLARARTALLRGMEGWK